MQEQVLVIDLHEPITEAAALMARKRIRRLPVVARHANGPVLAGIISATDILHAFPPDVNPFAVITPESRRQGLTVGDIMSRHVVTATPEMPIEQAAMLMSERKIGALPVLRERQLVGLITESDIFRAFIGFFAPAGAGARVTFDISKGEDVFAFLATAARERKVRIISLISTQENDRPVCVVRFAGEGTEKLLEDLWNSHHTVLNVVRFT